MDIFSTRFSTWKPKFFIATETQQGKTSCGIGMDEVYTKADYFWDSNDETHEGRCLQNLQKQLAQIY